MNKRFHSISRRLIAMSVLVSVTALLLACTGFIAYDFISIRNATVQTLSSQAHIIAENSVTPLMFNDPEAAVRTLNALRSSPHVVAAELTSEDGHVFAKYGTSPVPELVTLEKGRDEKFSFGEDRLVLARRIRFEGADYGTLYLVSDLREMNSRLWRYLLIASIVLVVSTLAAIVLSARYRRAISTPIVQLADIAKHISETRDYEMRAFSVKDQSEVSVLVEAFNEMLHQIENRENALSELARESLATLQSIPQLVFTTNAAGKITFYNRRWYDYTGMKETAEPDSWGHFIHPDERVRVHSTWANSVATSSPYRSAYRLRRHDGIYRWQFAQALPIFDSGGRVERWFGTVTDIHEQKLAEEALLRSEKLAVTGRLAATIAHEINNPLAAITNAVHLLKIKANDPESSELLKILSEEIGRVSHIVKSTLGLSRQGAERAEVSVAKIIEEVLVLFERRVTSRGIRLERRYDPADPRIYVVPNELRQVVSNLLTNALDVLSGDGTLAISVTARRNGAHRGVQISVADTGTGVPREIRTRVFEPFFSTKADKGTGLGLWISKELIEKMGGTLRFKTSTDPARHGTVFSMFLPEDRREEAKSA